LKKAAMPAILENNYLFFDFFIEIPWTTKHGTLPVFKLEGFASGIAIT